MIEHSIRGLRITTDVEARVLSKVRKRCAEETKWVVPLANAVLDLPETRPEIRRMWQKLIAGLRTVMLTPADSSRASRFTMLRRAGRHEEKMAFVTQPAMEAAASAVFGDSGTDEPTPKAKRALVGVYLSLEDVSSKYCASLSTFPPRERVPLVPVSRDDLPCEFPPTLVL